MSKTSSIKHRTGQVPTNCVMVSCSSTSMTRCIKLANQRIMTVKIRELLSIWGNFGWTKRVSKSWFLPSCHQLGFIGKLNPLQMELINLPNGFVGWDQCNAFEWNLKASTHGSSNLKVALPDMIKKLLWRVFCPRCGCECQLKLVGTKLFGKIWLDALDDLKQCGSNWLRNLILDF